MLLYKVVYESLYCVQSILFVADYQALRTPGLEPIQRVIVHWFKVILFLIIATVFRLCDLAIKKIKNTQYLQSRMEIAVSLVVEF